MIQNYRELEAEAERELFLDDEEIKQLTRVLRNFPNREACLRLVRALAVEHSEE